MTKVEVDIADLQAILSLLDAYQRKERRGAHFKDDSQMVPSGFYMVRIDRLRKLVKDAGP